ncbi:MAG TPA: LAGLIDADG family homing endonuclease [Candidatus Nanoarchaeia archaeon]|nr:LAGLIDADG family homing endonuclease [Candidatus Nanoarchaeia archaeon]
MNSNTIRTFDYLQDFKRVHIKITDSFFLKIKGLLKKKYLSIKGYALYHQINQGTFSCEFRRNIYHPFQRLIQMANNLHIPQEELYGNIHGFYHWGSHREIVAKIPLHLSVGEFFAEGYALYLAEGDNGSNAKTKPRKFRFTNSDANVINHMIRWLNTYLPDNPFSVEVISPRGNLANQEEIRGIIQHSTLRFTEEDYNRKIKYKICLNSAIIIDFFLALKPTVKMLCSKDRSLAAAYIRGMMIGEGTAYFGRARYVRIEMRNEEEIRYLHYLLTMLGYSCTPMCRSTRHDMWSLYIGAKQLEKFASEIGFGIHRKRQGILERANAKVLKINQYC